MSRPDEEPRYDDFAYWEAEIPESTRLKAFAWSSQAALRRVGRLAMRTMYFAALTNYGYVVPIYPRQKDREDYED